MEDYPRDVYRIRVGDWDMQVPEATRRCGKLASCRTSATPHCTFWAPWMRPEISAKGLRGLEGRRI